MALRTLSVLCLCVALVGCSLPSTAIPTATLAPTPTDSPATTNTPQPTVTVVPSQVPTAPPEPQPTATPSPEPTESALGSLKPTKCQFEIPDGYTVTCGLLQVLEDRSKPNGRMIELAVARFKSKRANPQPDPVVYLEGGPGGHALQQLDYTFADYFAPMAQERDVIVFDQRGTGYSKPSLACDEYTRWAYDVLDEDLTIADANRQFVEQMLACSKRLKSQGIDLAAYNSLASAADLEDLRTALGYKTWNLYGISYGTRLALTTMREYPASIRSVILDSTRSLQSNESSTPADVNRALEQLFSGCKEDPDCNKAFPDLRTVFYDTVAKLNKEPATGEATNPLNGRSYKIVVDGDAFLGLTIQALYSTSIITQLPQAIQAAYEGTDYSFLMRMAMNSAIQNEFLSLGMFYAVRCNEEVSFETPQALAAADDAFPQLNNAYDMTNYTDICDAWKAGKAPAVENQPVTSDIPTLILAGQYDPATPPEDGKAASQTLSNSYYYEFPGLGHGVSVDGDCPQSITLAFLDDPTRTPDSSCIAAMAGPAWVGTGAPPKLVAFTSDTFGFTSVVPEGWQEVSTGIHTRGSSDIGIIQFALPLGIEEAKGWITQQFSLTDDFEQAGQHKGKALTWDLYKQTLQGLPVDIGLAESDGKSFVVMLVSDNLERESLYDNVFLPALDALTPT